MSLFIDTSAIYSLLFASDPRHQEVLKVFTELEPSTPLHTSSYVLVESCALLQNRQGMSAVRALCDRIVPLLEVAWITPDLHERSVRRLIASDRRQLSLVDCASFEVMKELGLTRAFTLDPHFGQAGFEVWP